MMQKKTKITRKKIIKYLSIFSQDSRLNVWHIAILIAILQLGFRQGQKRIIKVSRSKIMSLSHVNTLPTYYKYFKELQSLGYIKYSPSYHPGCRSEIELTKKRLSQM